MPTGEFQWIAGVRRAAAHGRRDVVLGIGDDAALLRLPAGHDLVACVDTLVAGVHFPADTDPAAIGWKALAVNLSDLAAMGAMPRWITLALTVPQLQSDWLAAFMRGIRRLARRHAVALVGGDTTRGPLSITIQALGSAPRGKALRRDGARSGDMLFVSGCLGDAAAGLALVQSRLRAANQRDARALRDRLDRPTPRIALGLALRGVASACIDVSDGLAQDLDHVLRASGVGARIEAASLPASPALRRVLPAPAARAQLALSGGDDYELCFSVPPSRVARVAAIAARLRLRLSCIGGVVARRGLQVHDGDGACMALSRTGFDHFA